MGFSADIDPGVDIQVCIRGRISANGPIQVLQGGLVQGALTGQWILVEGEVQGDLGARGAVEVRASACVEGEVTAGSLRVDDGARFRGRCSIGVTPEEAAETRPPRSLPDMPSKPRWFWQR